MVRISRAGLEFPGFVPLPRCVVLGMHQQATNAADIAGIRCLLVHAKDDAARQWYESWEFEPSPTDPYHLFLMLKDLKGMLS